MTATREQQSPAADDAARPIDPWRRLAGPLGKSNAFVRLYAVVLALGVGVPLNPPTAGAILSIPVAFAAVRFLFQTKSRLITFVPFAFAAMFVLSPAIRWVSLSTDSQRTTSTERLAADFALFGTLGLLLLGGAWAASKLGVVPVFVLVGIGIAANGLINPDYGNLEDQLKFRLVPTLAFVILGLVARAALPLQFIAAFGVLALGAYANLRASTAAALFAMAVTAVGLLRSRRAAANSQRSSFLQILVIPLIAFLAIGVVYPAAANNGLLGAEIQARQEIQQESSEGAGAFGGRIEIGASLGLLKNDFWGRGPGVMPSPADFAAAKQGFADVGVDFASSNPNSNLAALRLTDEIYLHSSLMEMWWAFGPIAFLLFAGVIVVLLATLRLVVSTTSTYMLGLMSYAIARSIWDITFEPARPIGYNLFITTGICLYLLTRDRMERAASLEGDAAATLAKGHRTTNPRGASHA